MNSPLTYPDQPRDDNLAEFFLKLLGACIKKGLHVLLALVLRRATLTFAAGPNMEDNRVFQELTQLSRLRTVNEAVAIPFRTK